MRDKRTHDPHDAPVETEGMGGAGGGDIDDVGDVGYPRRADDRDLTGGRGIPEGMGGAGGGDLDDIDIPDGQGADIVDELGRTRLGALDGEPGVVTGITTGEATDDATEGPGSPWEHIDDGLREGIERGTDSPSP
jgi:hypothetical protein